MRRHSTTSLPQARRAAGVALLALLSLARGPAAAQQAVKPRPVEVKVLVLNFDPVVVPRAKTRLHEVGRWNDPRVLAKGYADDVQKASRGLVRYKVVEWKDVDEFPAKTDGFVYTLEEFLRCNQAGKGWHQPDGADYPKLIARHKVAERVERGEVDEVWWFGGPYFGFHESAMAGRGAFYINGGTYGPDQVRCKRAFAVMGFNYERGVAEMLHNLCHRTESTLARVFGGWQADKLDHDWARFAANFKQSGGVAAVGNCHYPPNADSDYDYGNKRLVDSTADDWLNYPNLKGTRKRVNCESWGGPDYHRNYMRWWFLRLPHAPGVNANGRLNNWWEYVLNFNSYDDRGRPARNADPASERRAAEWVLSAGGRVTVEGEAGRREARSAAELPAGEFVVRGAHLAGRPVADADLGNVVGLGGLTHLDLGGTKVTDAGLGRLADLSPLRWLSLSRTNVTGPGLAGLGGLSRLTYLELNGTPLGDAGLGQLPELPELGELHLTGTKLTDAGTKSLKGRAKLGTLSLAETAVTDTGLRQLADLRELKVLFVGGTVVTDEGVNRLKRAVSGLDVRR